MKKILLLSGIIVCCVLLFGGYILFGDFGNFAHNLGDESKKIVVGKDDRFIGIWNIEDEEENLVFSSDSSLSGFYNGVYETNQEKLFINISTNNDLTSYVYNYYFSNNNKELTLSEETSGAGMILTRI